MATLSGVINDTGTTTVTATDTVTGNAKLEGHGSFDLSTSGAEIVSGLQDVKLINVNDTISGEGFIGASDNGGNLLILNLINDAGATIEANVASAVLRIETNTLATNLGAIEAIDGGTLEFDNQDVNNGLSGKIVASGANSIVQISIARSTGARSRQRTVA